MQLTSLRMYLNDVSYQLKTFKYLSENIETQFFFRGHSLNLSSYLKLESLIKPRSTYIVHERLH